MISETQVDYTAQGSSVNLSSNGADGLAIGLALADVAGDFTTTLRDSYGNSATSTITSTQSIRSYTELEFLFANFQGGNDIDLTNISSVSLRYTPVRDGADLLVDHISTAQINPASVPEPTTFGLILIGVAALAMRRRRNG